MSVEVWLAFVAASTALLLIPGPTVLLVVSHALSHGRRVALSTAAGVAVGDAVAMTASLAGLGAVVLASAALFTALKWAGAAYLVYLGLRLILARPAAAAAAAAVGGPSAPLSNGTAFRQAAVVTVLNPKGIAFFIAFVPQFLDPSAPLGPQFAILIATFAALGAINALAYALLADRLRVRIGRPEVLRALSRLGGGALVAMGLATLTLRRAPS